MIGRIWNAEFMESALPYCLRWYTCGICAFTCLYDIWFVFEIVWVFSSVFSIIIFEMLKFSANLIFKLIAWKYWNPLAFHLQMSYERMVSMGRIAREWERFCLLINENWTDWIIKLLVLSTFTPRVRWQFQEQQFLLLVVLAYNEVSHWITTSIFNRSQTLETFSINTRSDIRALHRTK